MRNFENEKWPGGPTVAFSAGTKASTVDMFRTQGVSYRIPPPPPGFMAKPTAPKAPSKPMVDEAEFGCFLVEGF